MRRRRRTSQESDHPSPADLHRAPIISERLIIRESSRTDAKELERTMDAAQFGVGDRTSDGARRFGDGMAEVPVWSATRAVCVKGSANIVGGVVVTEIDALSSDVRRIGWWLQPGAEHYAPELIAATDERLRALGADVVVLHLRAAAGEALRIAEQAGFRRGEALRHTTVSGQELDFWEYLRP